MRWQALAPAALAGLIGCGSEPFGTEKPRGLSELPPAQLEGVVFDGYRAGNRDLQLRARYAQVDWESDEVHLEHVHVSLPAEERGGVEVRADRGKIDLETRRFFLEGRVVATTGQGERFETRALHYVPARETLVSEDPVRVTGSRLDAEGSGMELNVRTRRIRLLGPVRARTRPE